MPYFSIFGRRSLSLFMKKFPVVILLMSIVCIIGCKPKINYIVKIKPHKLTPGTMYNADKVSDYLFDAEEMQADSLKVKSEKAFLKGLDLYKNKKNPSDAIDYFEQSALFCPDSKTYYELGNALLDAQVGKDFVDKVLLKQADSAFMVAKVLGFKPVSQLYYCKACAQNMMNEIDTNESTPYYELYEACREGFSDTNSMKRDKRIASFTKTMDYRKLIAECMSKKGNQSTLSFFQLYKNSYPVISQPFEIKTDKVDMQDYKQSISYDFKEFIPEMENTQFGRSVANDYIYVGRVAQNRMYTAVLYYSINYYGGTMQPINTKLVTYDTAGRIIDSRLFACQCSPEKIKTGKIDNNVIILEDYKRIWQHPVDSVAFENNTVLKYESLGKATFKLTDSGKIVKQNMTQGYSDSAKIVTTH